ncbi:MULTISPECIES: COP23 domain-containing protein [unclassified Microcoleus]|uniref:COP23 domain-containing protein n=1 Tax=unclassified Microcoleus TaxID=2642155 RepID=UPI0025EF829C|nr:MULTISPECIES: COP23 domain-containing protein [unclassified Microcoleus]
MKFKILTGLLTGLVVSTTTSALFSQPSRAGNNSFFCATLNRQPVTLVRTPRGNVPLVRWTSNNYFPPPWTAQKRCQEVGRRFQRNYDNGTLKYINTGTLNGEPVVCAAVNKDDACTNRTLLFTLKRGSDADATLQRLMDRRGLASGYILSETGPGSVDVDRYLEETPVEENVSPISP